MERLNIKEVNCPVLNYKTHVSPLNILMRYVCIYMYVTYLATVIICVFGEGNLDSLPLSVPHPALSVDLF